MCCHTALIARPVQLALRFDRKADLIGDFRPAYRVSAFSHAEYPVITPDEQIGLFRWGLIPHWTRGLEEALAIRNRTVNARAETVFTKPSFRQPIRRTRCLVPVSGFFEWRHEGERKIPHYITVRDRPIAALAGIYDCWRNEATDETVATYSIITTPADETMRYLHNTGMRMPLILRPEDEERWLDPRLTEAEIAAFFTRRPDSELQYEVIGSDFIRKASGDPTILAPAENASVRRHGRPEKNPSGPTEPFSL